jgi:DNA-binding SARP family transcriptional activator
MSAPIARPPRTRCLSPVRTHWTMAETSRCSLVVTRTVKAIGARMRSMAEVYRTRRQETVNPWGGRVPGGISMTLALDLLGGFSTRPPLRLGSHKAEALLAFLALSGGRPQPRDKLAALLWPEATDERARHSLRQALVALRRGLGPSASLLVERGETVMVSPDAVDVDVLAFEALVRRGTAEALTEAATLYGGDLLSGLAVKEAPFEEWLLGERERLRDLLLDGLARLLARQMDADSLEAAVETASRLLALDPLQEVVHRTLMRLHTRRGRRTEALRQYQECVTALRQELGVEPERETRELYRSILREREAVAAPKVPAAWTRDTPLVGRDAELTMLESALGAALAHGGRTALVLGEAGIGKSRIIAELASRAALRGARVLAGHCHETEQTVPFRSWIEALRSGIDVADPDLAGVLEPSHRSELARLFSEFGAPPAGGGDDQVRLLEAMTALVVHATTLGPLVLVIEDLHWADEASLRLFAFLALRIGARPVLIVATTRDDEPSASPLFRRVVDEHERRIGAVSLRLAPLTEDMTATLVQALAHGGRDRRAVRHLATRAWALSEGNPFVVVEMVRAAADDPRAASVSNVPIPERVGALTRRRLGRLGEPARRLVAVAAVVGRDFDWALARLAAGLDEAGTAGALEELVLHRILSADGDRFDFTHDRVRRVVYADLIVPRRIVLHADVARAVEALHDAELDAHASALAHHWSAARDWPRTVRYLQRAGRGAATASAHRDAVACLEQALAVLERTPDAAPVETAIDIRFELRHSLNALGDQARIRACLHEAAALAERTGDRERLGWAAAYLTNCLHILGDHDGAVASGTRALAIADTTGADAIAAFANVYLGTAHYFRGEYRLAAERLGRGGGALDAHPDYLARGPQARPTVTARTFLAGASAETGAFDEGAQWAREARALAEASGDAWEAVHASWATGIVALRRGAVDQAITALEQGLARTRERDLPGGLVFLSVVLGWALVEADRGDEALALLAPYEADLFPILDVVRALGLLASERTDDARTIARRARDAFERRGERGFAAWAWWALGETAARGKPVDGAGAREAYGRALILARELGMAPLAARVIGAREQLDGP